MAGQDQGRRGIKDRAISHSAGIRPYKLDLRYATTAAFLAAKSARGENSSSAEKGDFFFDTTLNYMRYYNGSGWVSGATATDMATTAAGDAAGDLIYRDSATSFERLAIGAATKVLAVNGAGDAPEWIAQSAVTAGNATLAASASNVVTTSAGDAAGDLIYRDAAATLERLAKGTAGQTLVMNAGATAPSWVSGVQFATLAFNNTQLKALPSSPLTVVAAPAAGYMVEVISASFHLNYGSEVLVGDETLALRYKNAAGQLASSDVPNAVLVNAGDCSCVISSQGTPILLAKANTDGQALVFGIGSVSSHDLTGNASNDTTAQISVAYRIVATTF